MYFNLHICACKLYARRYTAGNSAPCKSGEASASFFQQRCRSCHAPAFSKDISVEQRVVGSIGEGASTHSHPTTCSLP